MEDKRGWYPSQDRSLPVQTTNDGGNEGDDMTPEAQELLESLLQHLLPTPVVSPPKATPIPSELQLLMQHLMGNDRPVQPAPTRRSCFTDMDVLIQNLLPVTPPAREQPTRESGRRDWSTVVCFSCGKPGHAASPVSRFGCYVSFSATGMAGREGGRRFCYAVTPDSGQTTPDGKRRLISISNDFGSQDPVDDDGMDMDVAREHDVPRGWTAPLTEAPVQLVGTMVACARLDYSDSHVPDRWQRFAEAQVPPVGTIVQCVRSDCSDFCVPNGVMGLLESARDTEESLPVTGEVVMLGMSPVVTDCWPQFAEAQVPPVGPLYIVLGRTVLIFVNRMVVRGC